MDMSKNFSILVGNLFGGKHVFEGIAKQGETTYGMLERAKAEMAKAKSDSEGAIGKEGDVDAFSNAVSSANYLLALIKSGVFPKESTPYAEDWGRTFDYITGSCINVAYGYMLLSGEWSAEEKTVSSAFSKMVDALFKGKHAFEGIAKQGETTYGMLERAKASMVEAKDASEGAISKEGDVDTFSNAVSSADYLLALIKSGVFPNESTPYAEDWGRTFDYITGSCINVAYGYMVLLQYASEKKPAEKKPAEKKPTEKKPAEKKPAEKKSAEKKAAEEKAENARKKFEQDAESIEAAHKAEAEKAEAEKAEAEKAEAEKAEADDEEETKKRKKPKKTKKTEKKGIVEKVKEGCSKFKSFLSGDDDDKEAANNKSEKNSIEILEDFGDE